MSVYERGNKPFYEIEKDFAETKVFGIIYLNGDKPPSILVKLEKYSEKAGKYYPKGYLGAGDIALIQAMQAHLYGVLLAREIPASNYAYTAPAAVPSYGNLPPVAKVSFDDDEIPF